MKCGCRRRRINVNSLPPESPPPPLESHGDVSALGGSDVAVVIVCVPARHEVLSYPNQPGWSIPEGIKR